MSEQINQNALGNNFSRYSIGHSFVVIVHRSIHSRRNDDGVGYCKIENTVNVEKIVDMCDEIIKTTLLKTLLYYHYIIINGQGILSHFILSETLNVCSQIPLSSYRHMIPSDAAKMLNIFKNI